MEIRVPFGSGELRGEIPDENLLAIALPPTAKTADDPIAELRRAVAEPVGTPKLAEMAKPGQKVVVLIDDYTRPTPTGKMLPVVLEALEKGGVPRSNVTVIVAGGLHRFTTREEVTAVLSEPIVRDVTVVIHDPDAADLVSLGTSSRGTPIKINRLVAEADLRIALGMVEPHIIAGYSGSAKSILPGISGRETVDFNHSMGDDLRARPGIVEGNPVREDMEEIARKANLSFVLLVVMNEKHQLIRAVAGDLVAAHREAVRVAESALKVTVSRPADIVVLSPGGYPRDSNLWQTDGKALGRVGNAARPGGVIIVTAECRDGFGEGLFEEWITMPGGAHGIIERFKREGGGVVGSKALRVAEKLLENKIILITRGLDPAKLANLPLKLADSLPEALEMAFGEAGPTASVLVAPAAANVLLEVAN